MSFDNHYVIEYAPRMKVFSGDNSLRCMICISRSRGHEQSESVTVVELESVDTLTICQVMCEDIGGGCPKCK
jgi:hypothetical protein